MIKPYNAIFSKHFYTKEESLKIDSTEKPENDEILDPVKINIRQSEWNDVMTVDKQLNLDVDTLAKMIKSGKPLFYTPIDKLKSELDWVLNDYNKVCYVALTLVSVALSVTSLAINVIVI